MDLEEKDLTYENEQADILPNSIERKRPNKHHYIKKGRTYTE